MKHEGMGKWEWENQGERYILREESEWNGRMGVVRMGMEELENEG